MKSWLPIPAGSHFSLANLPFGIISTDNKPTRRPAVAIGQNVLDLKAFADGGGFRNLQTLPSENISVFSETTLNAFAALGRPSHKAVRAYLRDIFRGDTPYSDALKTNEVLKHDAIIPLSEVQMHLPLAIGDYTDFFAGRNHAHNVGTFFRGPSNALNPNYNHLPVAYHGRASSVVVSGTPLRRPWGQALASPADKTPEFRPSKRLDIELELGMFLCRENKLGEPVSISDAEDYIFGYVLMNDWSARDIQQWEYVPLGPFNAKNFGTSISPWVVLADAMDPFKTNGLPNDIGLQQYLRESRTDNILDIQLTIAIRTSEGNEHTLTKTCSKNLLWSWPQMIAHHTISGCNLRPGDLFGSGTISGSEAGSYGSLLEQTQAGKQPIILENGDQRIFLEDGDSIIIRGWAGTDAEGLVGFGECSGEILPAVLMR